MYSNYRKLALSGIIAGLLSGSAFGISVTFITSGYNTDESVTANYQIETDASTQIVWSGYLTGPSGGGGIDIKRGTTGVLNDWLTTNAPVKGATLNGQAAGVYKVFHGFGGVPYEIFGYIDTKLTW